MPATLRLFLVFALLLGVAIPQRAAAQEATPGAETAWRLLDYIAVDYPGAVSGGRVISEAEYAEMREFSTSVRTRIAALPAHEARPRLLAASSALISAVETRAAPEAVARQARSLADDLLAAYPTPLAPQTIPNLPRGAALYAEQCAVCHGATGRGDGPGAAGLEPAPIAFTDRDRARERSLFGLYQVIGQGLDGTAMPSFAHLSAEDRWALAFYVGGFAYPEGASRAGERAWRDDPDLRAAVPDLEALTQVTPAALAARLGEPRSNEVVAYLRSHPEALAVGSTDGLDLARRKLAESLAAYRAGDARKA
ncbi:MAG: high-affinity iron transporter [Brevundimonas sp.]|jgi:high-affinity iron transporter